MQMCRRTDDSGSQAWRESALSRISRATEYSGHLEGAPDSQDDDPVLPGLRMGNVDYLFVDLPPGTSDAPDKKERRLPV